MPWLPEAIESLLQQTTSAFEILVIVDGGSDESLGYLRGLRDPRLRVIEQPNVGVTATLNRLLRETRTAWMKSGSGDKLTTPSRDALFNAEPSTSYSLSSWRCPAALIW